MTYSKRIFDLFVALVLGVLLLPFMVVIAVLILILDGRPILYISERMNGTTSAFQLIKFRTMRASSENSGVSGGDKSARITKTGALLRKTRLDELPQLWNVLRGDISFVGPRPPLRVYVERFPDIYAQVLQSRPGITGLASLHFHRHEEYLLSTCKTSEETDAVYARRCVPRKAAIDLLYQRKQSLCFDMRIMIETAAKVLR